MARTDLINIEGKFYSAGQLVDALAAIVLIKKAVASGSTMIVAQVAALANAVDTAPAA